MGKKGEEAAQPKPRAKIVLRAEKQALGIGHGQNQYVRASRLKKGEIWEFKKRGGGEKRRGVLAGESAAACSVLRARRRARVNTHARTNYALRG